MVAPLLQIALAPGISIETPDVGGIALQALPFVILAALVLGGLSWLRRRLQRRHRREAAFDRAVLLVTVPKESGEKGDGAQRDKTLQEIHEDIAVMEGVFSSVGGLKAQKGWKAWLYGRDDAFSFEIVAQGGLVSFYIAVPRGLRNYVEQQVQAQYPLAQIDEVEDYNIFSAQGEAVAAELAFARPSFFAIKTYKKLESDPLNSLTNALAKVEKADGAAIQIVVRSAPKSWRDRGLSIAKDMKGGMSLKEAMGKSGGSAFLSLVGKTISSGDKKDEKKEYRLTSLDEEMVKSIEEKASKLGLQATVRVVATSASEARARSYLDNIVNAFSQYNVPQFGNALSKRGPKAQRILEAFIYRDFREPGRTVMNGEELSSIYHFPLSSTETPNIRWLLARKAPPPTNLPKEGMLMGYVKYRGEEHPVRIKQQDRMRHMYVIGKSGVGKSEYLKQMMKQDIEAGRGFCAIDPHGELARDAIALVPKERAEDVIFFSPGDIERPMGLNLMEFDPAFPEQKTFVINEMLKIFDKLYDLKSTGGPMFEQYMRNAMLLVMDHPESGSTLMEIPRVLADEEFRKMKLSHCKQQVVIDFWTKEAQKAGGEASLANMVPYITSKLTPFISNDIMRPIIGQQESAFNVRRAMDEGKILLLDLSKGKLGDLNAYLIGMVLVGKILMAALSRQDMDKKDRKDFFLYIDEFQNFLTDSIAVILSEARKYGLGLVIAHQFIGQLTKNNDTAIRDAIFGNVGTMCAFRVGAEDADFLTKEFQPVFTPYDLINCEAATANVKLLIDNTASRPFNMNLAPMVKGESKYVEAIKQLSRLTYGRDRFLIEEEIRQRTQIAEPKSSLDGLEL